MSRGLAGPGLAANSGVASYTLEADYAAHLHRVSVPCGVETIWPIQAKAALLTVNAIDTPSVQRKICSRFFPLAEAEACEFITEAYISYAWRSPKRLVHSAASYPHIFNPSFSIQIHGTFIIVYGAIHANIALRLQLNSDILFEGRKIRTNIKSGSAALSLLRLCE